MAEDEDSLSDNAGLPESDPDLRELVDEADYLERVVREVNYVPDGMQKEAVYDLCRVARLISTSPPDSRPQLLRTLSDELAALDKIVPRTRDPETRAYEFKELRNALNGFGTIANVLANKPHDAPPPPEPDEPRNDPDTPEAEELATQGQATATTAKAARLSALADDFANVGVDQTHAPNAKREVLAHIDKAEALALLTKLAAPLKDMTARSFAGLARASANWDKHLASSLKVLGVGFEIGSKIAYIFSLSNVLKELGKLTKQYEGKLRKSHEDAKSDSTVADENQDDVASENFDELMAMLVGHLKNNETAEAQAISGRIIRHPDYGTGISAMDLYLSNVKDLSPLSGLTALQSLDLAGTGVTEAGPLSGLTALQSLDLAGTGVTDVGPLSGLTALQSLDLAGTGVTEAGPLSGLTALQSLDLTGTGVTDVGPLSGLTALQSLNLAGTGVTDLEPLKELAGLEYVILPDGAEWHPDREPAPF